MFLYIIDYIIYIIEHYIDKDTVTGIKVKLLH